MGRFLWPTLYNNVDKTSDSYSLTFVVRFISLFLQIFVRRLKTLHAFPILVLHSLSQFPLFDIWLPTEILDHFDFCTLGPHYSRVFPAVTDHNLAFRSIHAASRFMYRPTYPDIYSTSSDNFCMPVCEVSMRAISSAKSKLHSFLPFVYSSPPL